MTLIPLPTFPPAPTRITAVVDPHLVDTLVAFKAVARVVVVPHHADILTADHDLLVNILGVGRLSVGIPVHVAHAATIRHHHPVDVEGMILLPRSRSDRPRQETVETEKPQNLAIIQSRPDEMRGIVDEDLLMPKDTIAMKTKAGVMTAVIGAILIQSPLPMDGFLRGRLINGVTIEKVKRRGGLIMALVGVDEHEGVKGCLGRFLGHFCITDK